ncbi:MAG: DUF4884 domain-containing protein [Bacteroides sp.]|nr:DUF4884 domain-containing protein [Bacteroides sp.]
MFSFYSCFSGQALVSRDSDNNRTYTVDYLFEHDGCKVYRFYDRGNYVYFTNCRGNVISISNDSTKTYTQNTIIIDD